MAAPPRDVALAEETLEGAAAVVAVAVVEVVVVVGRAVAVEAAEAAAVSLYVWRTPSPNVMCK